MFNIDKTLQTIVDIFNNSEVQLVRLNGLHKYLCKLNNEPIDIEIIDKAIHKLKKANIIFYQYILKCPYCHEITYQIENIPINKLKVCDTCQNLYMPKLGETLFELPYDYNIKDNLILLDNTKEVD